MPDPDLSVRVGLDHDRDDPALVYTDITDRVHYGDGGREVTVQLGRQNEQSDPKPTEMSWALKNHDNRFTPNNPDSDLYGKWEIGRRCQIAETVDGEEFILGTCFLQIPDMAIVDANSSQPVTVTATDRIGWLESAPAFEGTLAEHIRAEGGNLATWFPLTDPYPHMSADTTAVLARAVYGFFDEPVPKEPEELIRAASVEGPPGDDQSYPSWEPAPNAAGTAYFGYAGLVAPINVPVGPTDVLAVSAWALPSDRPVVTDPVGRPPGNLVILRNAADDFSLELIDRRAEIRAFSLGSPSTTVDGSRELERDVWRLVTARLDMATGALDLWVGTDLVASGVATPPAGGAVLTRIEIGRTFWGSVGQVQVRVGAGVMTHAEHIAQHQHGWQGLHRQTVAERIVTLAGYAGVPDTEVDVPAACSTPMQVARLSGVNPADAIRRAAATGQDTPLTTPAGLITAVPRAQQYNQPVTMDIPWGWIRRRSMKARPDPPLSDVVVRRTGGGTARRSDPVRARRYGVKSLQHELDTAIDADPANLADWSMSAHGLMRTRSPQFVINMLNRTASERKALLRLAPGSRIRIPDMPAGAPEDLPHLIVQGIKHTIGPGVRRLIQFNTSPLLGPSIGDPPACPVIGDLVSTAAIVAY